MTSRIEKLKKKKVSVTKIRPGQKLPPISVKDHNLGISKSSKNLENSKRSQFEDGQKITSSFPVKRQSAADIALTKKQQEKIAFYNK